ncbi:GA2L3 protein, partial [Oreotrochilus melanogaster]|nr:GA2L3 protein [Oreotrochilus melanogaster]
GTSRKLQPPAHKLPPSAHSQPASKTSSAARTRMALVHSETLRKRIRSPDAPKMKFALAQGSSAPVLHPVPSSSKKQLPRSPATAETVASKHKRVATKPVSVTEAKANSVAPRAARPPVTNLCAVAKFAHSQQFLVKPPSENPIEASGTGSRHHQKAPQTASDPARNLKSASVLKHSASAPSLAVSKASKSSPTLASTSKNLSSAVSKQPNVSTASQVGLTSPKPLERTPLSVVRLPQTSAKVAVTKKPAQPLTKNLQTSESLASAAKKPLPKGKLAMACNKGLPGVSKGPLTKSRQDDHYFVMTGSKKPRK